MTSPDGDVAAGVAAAGPAPSVPASLDDELVLEVLERLVRAEGEADVASAGLPVLLGLRGVRGVAVVVRDRGSAVVVGSAGYECGSMAPGAVLPIDAGLPVTEAVRRRATVVQGAGPSWVALHFVGGRGRSGALLLSVDGPPPALPADLARLERIARAVGQGLQRAADVERTSTDLAQLLANLTPPAVSSAGRDVALRSVPHDGAIGGDVVLHAPDGRGGQWSVVADVCGSGVPAAVTARIAHAALAALVEQAESPAALLVAADRVLRPVVGPDCFITALVVRAVDGRLDIATAGHPPPVVLTADGAHGVPVEPGAPLALETGGPPVYDELSVTLPVDAVVLLHTDGLLDRRCAHGPCAAEVERLVAGAPLDDLGALADAVLAAADAVGVAGDDVSLLLTRPRHTG